MLKRILKNTSYLLFAQVVTKILSFFYAFFLAKQLGVVEFGNYSVALSYFSVLSAVVDLGVSRYLIREVSKKEVLFPVLFVNSLILRLVFSVILVAGFGLILILTDSDQVRVTLAIVAALTIIPQTIGLTADAGLIVKNKFKFSALGIFLLNVSTIVIGWLFVTQNATAFNALLGIVLGHVIYMAGVILLLLISTKDLQSFTSHFELKTLFAIFKGSLLYGVMGTLGLIYFKVDTLLLGYLKGPADAGIYSAAYRFLEGVVFIPAAFETAFFPVLSKMHSDSEQVLSPFGRNKKSFPLYLKSVFLLIGLSIPFVLSFYFLVPGLIGWYLKGEYQMSEEVVSILSLAIPFIFALAAQGAFLLSSEKYLKKLVFISLINLVVNIIGNLIFIPYYGVFAAAWMTVISQMIAFLLYFVTIYYGFRKVKDE